MKVKSIDYGIFFVVLGLVIFGMVMISSVSVYPSFKVTSLMAAAGKIDEPNNYFYLIRNISHVIVGFFLFAFIAKTPYELFERYSKHIFFGGIALLVSVLFIWAVYNGARGWINVPYLPFSLQPVEFMKLALILYGASFLKKKRSEVPTLTWWFIPFMVILAAVVVLLALQPDFGSILLIAPIAIGMFFVGGGNLKHLAVSALIFFSFALMIYGLGKTTESKFSYVSQRIDNFLSDNKTSIQNQSINFQTKQGLIAIGSWGFFGLWFGKSVQKFGYLPEVEGDFIFSVIAEELWFVGVMVLMTAYGFIGYRWYRIARRVEDPFAKYVATWVTTWILAQMCLNVGVNLNILPLTGVTMPFVSYGGSSLMSLLIGIGILLNISKSVRYEDVSTSNASLFGRRRSLYF